MKPRAEVTATDEQRVRGGGPTARRSVIFAVSLALTTSEIIAGVPPPTTTPSLSAISACDSPR